MIGNIRNTIKLFDDKKIFIVALDRGQIGHVNGLENIENLVDTLSETNADGFILNVGNAHLMAKEKLLNKKFILRTSIAGSVLSKNQPLLHKQYIKPETVLQLGADAVVCMLSLGEDDFDNIQYVAKLIEEYHRFGICVIVEVLGSPIENTQSFETQYNGAKIATEIGADVLKLFNCENFEKIVKESTIPVILAGGESSKLIDEVVADALKWGVDGFAFGRNIFQSDNPKKKTEELVNFVSTKGVNNGK